MRAARERGRRGARRSGEGYYLDGYYPELVFTGIPVFCMGSLDALFPLTLLSRGGYESSHFNARRLNTVTKVGRNDVLP
jgi:hypothetical protein